jgi:spore coat polysaccharide biosynthesis protein SpsF
MRIAIIQARMSSTRLPGKVLLKIDSRPMLSYMLERVVVAKSIDKIVVATSTDQSDDIIAEWCKVNNVKVYRGSLDDVLDRYYQTAKQFKVDTIVRLTSDCPVIDPKIIDSVVGVYNNGMYDYAGNTMPPKWTFPVGMDVEVFSFKSLERAWKEARKPSDREHVTFYFWKNPHTFSVFRHNSKEDLSKYRLTVDYPEDFEVVKSIFTALYPKNPLFSMKDIINFLNNNPKVYKINANVKGGWRSAYK